MTIRALASLLIAAPAAAAPPEVLNPAVLDTRTHEASCYTQGLLLHDGSLFESCGGYGGNYYGPSSVREVNPATGAVIRSAPMPDPDPGQYFAEGLARVGDHLIQLTWQEGVAFVWDIDTFTVVDQLSYSGQGWGLCYDGTRLIMSDGSYTLTFRDPSDFRVLGSVDVTLEDPPGTINHVNSLNELECVGSHVYANVYTTDWILDIDVASGQVTRWIQAPDLLTPQERASADVLNGIAHDPATGNFLITGKLWPKLFEVRFGAAPPSDGAPVGGDPASPAGDATTTGAGDPATPKSGGTVKSNGCAASPASSWVVVVLLAGRRRTSRFARQLS